MNTSNEQVGRLLALIPFLQTHRGVSVADAAATFGVSERQIMDDLAITWMCGLPGGLPDDLIEIDMDAARGEGRIELANADYLSRPVRFTPDEAMSLVVALRVVAEVVPGDMAPAVASALAKLDTLGEDHGARSVVIEVSAGGERIRDAVAAAIRDGARLRLRYDAPTRTSHPVVDPARIDLRDGSAYLQAWSLDRGAWRTYRLDRIGGCERTGERALDHGPAPEPQPGWFNHLDTANTVTLALAAEAAWAGEYYPTSPTPPELAASAREGETVCTFPVADPDWLSGLLLRLGPGVRVVAPDHAADDACARAREALSLIAATR